MNRGLLATSRASAPRTAVASRGITSVSALSKTDVAELLAEQIKMEKPVALDAVSALLSIITTKARSSLHDISRWVSVVQEKNALLDYLHVTWHDISPPGCCRRGHYVCRIRQLQVQAKGGEEGPQPKDGRGAGYPSKEGCLVLSWKAAQGLTSCYTLHSILTLTSIRFALRCLVLI